jgi:hypothetical protein
VLLPKAFVVCPSKLLIEVGLFPHTDMTEQRLAVTHHKNQWSINAQGKEASILVPDAANKLASNASSF